MEDELVNKAEGTKNRYQNFFSEFLEYVKMTADELLKQRQQDVLDPNLKIQRRIETQFLAFIDKKNQEGITLCLHKSNQKAFSKKGNKTTIHR